MLARKQREQEPRAADSQVIAACLLCGRYATMRRNFRVCARCVRRIDKKTKAQAKLQ